MFILKKLHQPGVYVPLRALFLVSSKPIQLFPFYSFMLSSWKYLYGKNDQFIGGNRIMEVLRKQNDFFNPLYGNKRRRN